MLGKDPLRRDQVGDHLEQYEELAQDDRQVMRNLLRKATYLELARLLADKEMAPALDAIRNEQHVKIGRVLEPRLIASAILAIIALAAVTCAILEW